MNPKDDHSGTTAGGGPHVLLSGLLSNFEAAAAKEILELYSKSASGLLKRLEAAFVEDQIAANEVRSIAHELKGASSMASFTEMESLCKTLGEAAKEGNWAEAKEIHGKLLKALRELEEARQSWLDSQ